MTTTPPPLDLDNIQGDILSGLLKKTETYVFFQIDDKVDDFRRELAQIVPLVTTTTAALNDRRSVAQNKKDAASQGLKPPTLPIAGFNISFSQFGLTKMGIVDDLGDPAFAAGQLAGAGPILGDQGSIVGEKFVPNWIPAFKNPVHGVMIFSGDCQATVDKKLSQVEAILRVGKHDATIHEVIKIVGVVRPGKEKGHEHFGFLDGISNPAVEGFDTNPNPGQETVPASVILLGHDNVARPAWATDGSFLAFRYLFQLVPEFNEFLRQNPIPGLDPKLGSELLGARMVGRWKSGAPVDLAPLADDPALGADPLRNNNFSYTFPGDFDTQTRCPFAAHVRKTNPRNDLEGLTPPVSTASRRIIRRGIQFGPEVTAREARDKKTHLGRGLLFVCYQSIIGNGFQFVQQSWANNANFPPKSPQIPGFDPIIGQTGNANPRTMIGTNPNAQGDSLTLSAEWVVPRGGEYFFSPSISALRDTFALGA